MKNLKKKATLLLAGLALVATTLVGCSQPLDNSAVVSTVNGETITLGVANFYARYQQVVLENTYAGLLGMEPAEMWRTAIDVNQTYESATKDSILTNLEALLLIRQHAEAYGVSLSEEEQRGIAQAAELFVTNNSDEAIQAVSGQEEHIIEVLELLTLQVLMEEPMQAGYEAYVSDEEARQMAMDYVLFPFEVTAEDGSRVELDESEQAELRTTAHEFTYAVRISEEHDMFGAAEAFDVNVLSNTFDESTTFVPAEVVEAAWAVVDAGEVLEPIETIHGIYVVKVTDLLDREATDMRIEEILGQRRQEAFNERMESWQEAAEIERDERVWARVDFARMGFVLVQPEEEVYVEEEPVIEEMDDVDSEAVSAEESATDSEYNENLEEEIETVQGEE